MTSLNEIYKQYHAARIAQEQSFEILFDAASKMINEKQEEASTTAKTKRVSTHVPNTNVTDTDIGVPQPKTRKRFTPE